MTSAWSVAVFSSREDVATLTRTLDAVVAASASHPTTIDLLVDGNPPTAEAMSRSEPAMPSGCTIRLWAVTWRDKACTWNRYLYELAPPARLAFFVDGYVRPVQSSFDALAAALEARPEARAAGGVPTVGPSAARLRRQLLADSGLHGSLYALRAETVATLRQQGFRLPLGLYRNDSLLGAVMAFSFDPARHAWDPSRIAIVEGATWDNDVAPIMSVRGLRSYAKRRARQAQGRLENAAVREHLAIRQRSPDSLPRTVAELVATAPAEAMHAAGAVDRALMRRAKQRLMLPADWSRCNDPPRLLRTWN